MAAPVISVRRLGKRYQLGESLAHDTLGEHLSDAAGRLLSFLRLKPRHPNGAATPGQLWALRDVNFDVQEGEVVGIIGRNGAGKSTLLKILSQITEPTEGEVRVIGRLASLLEVGTGFHPELTGRENIFLNGAILGMTQAEIRRRFDEIVAFAEVEKFLDTPVKRYSSGMYVRLAFAVAAHLEPEILVVDEVLAVGDSGFQAKCLAKMDSVSSREGRTVLFVSHNLAAVQRLCTRGVYLEHGQIKAIGPISKTLDAYQRSFERAASSAGVNEPEAGEARFLGWELIHNRVEEAHSCFSRDVCQFALTLFSRINLDDAFIGFAIWDAAGTLVLAGSSLDNDQPVWRLPQGRHELIVKVRLPLKAGLYQLDVSLNSRVRGLLERCHLEPRLNVLPLLKTSLPENWHGLVTEEISFVIAGPPATQS